MFITKPALPPKAGYVEVIDESGNHVYRPTPETVRRLEAEKNTAAEADDTGAMLVDHEYRLTLIELGV